MLILALDSTALAASVALCDDERLIAEFILNTGHTHSETLLPMVEAALEIAGRRVDDIELFACTAGPGSFTGVRIGVATIKGLAFDRGVPCVGVSTLDVLAGNGRMLNGLLCPVMNARREQVYNALFSSDGQALTRLCDDRALAISALGEDLLSLAVGRSVYLMGDGARLVYDALSVPLEGQVELRMLPERLIHQSGYETAQVALQLWRTGAVNSDYTDATLSPVYLRPSQAERVRMEKLKQQN